MKQATTAAQAEQRLRAAALLGRRTDGDYLVLDDATMRAALDGERALGPAQAAALLASPLTLRRFRTLADARRLTSAAAAPYWDASSGMLRAAADGAPLATLETDDGHWRLHFVAAPGGWQVILKLDPGAPFAASVLQDGALLKVVDGAGAVVLQGGLDRDGECEQAWPFPEAPAPHFQRHGARFGVSRVSTPGALP